MLLMKLALLPSLKLCTCRPMRNPPGAPAKVKALITLLNDCPDCKLNKIPRVSPGFTPFEETGGSESAENPAVVTKAGSAFMPPGKFPGVAGGLKLTPLELLTCAIPSKVPSSKYNVGNGRTACANIIKLEQGLVRAKVQHIYA